MNKYFTISEVSKILNLIDPKTKKPLNHILRYWENEFKEIKPKKINSRRYYSQDQVEIIKMIKFLLKNKGMSLSCAESCTGGLISSEITKVPGSSSVFYG